MFSISSSLNSPSTKKGNQVARKKKVRSIGPVPVVKLNAWSHSRWDTYEACPLTAKFKYIEKLEEEQGDAAKRGQRIHEEAEALLSSNGSLTPELEVFSKEFAKLKSKKNVKSEALWAFTDQWVPTGWFDKDCWCRVKTDAHYLTKRNSVLVVIDYKTGKIRETKHEKQMELYALAGMLQYPNVRTIQTELWYIDQGEIHDSQFDASERDDLIKKWQARIKRMLSDETFKPCPGTHCRWCSYSRKKGGPCGF
jgi:CRISPR/Cas system-associated exonuclease Cas4 (RecB family)